MKASPLPNLPTALVSSDGVDALNAVAGQFLAPAGVLIECPLGEASASADISMSFSRPTSADEADIMSGGWPVGTVWERVRRFVDVWRDPSGPLWSDVRSLWLEFDLRERDKAAPAPLPSAFFGHSNGLRSRATIIAGLDLLLDQEAPAARLLTSDCLDALPLNGGILFAGVMLARRPSTIRFCIDGPPWQNAPADLICLARHVIVQVEARAPAADRVGFELYQGRRQRGRTDVWRPLLDRLVDVGAARADRCSAALEWPGYAYDESSGPRVIARWINHVKLTCEAGALTEAKIYLQFATAWESASSDADDLIGS